MRKEADFEVMDKITIYIDGNDTLSKYLSDNKEEVMRETMADAVSVGNVAGYTKEWDINGEHVTLGVEKR